MTRQPAWQWNEHVQVGVDYQNVDEVRAYDARMRALRDIDQENAAITAAAGLRPEHTVVEIGSGTGAFTRHAARLCAKVYACDVSAAMLQYARAKAEEAKITNIEFCHAGFLTYEHQGEPVDLVVSQLALHHLPDFWKLVALKRVAAMLKPGGRFYLTDVVFPDAATEGPHYFDGLVEKAPANSRQELLQHIRQEYSTLDWILEGMLTHAGFVIEERIAANVFLTAYVCTKAVGKGSE